MDPASPVDFSRLMQYGAIGVIAMGLLVLIVALVKQLVTHALKQVDEARTQVTASQAQMHEMHLATVKALQENTLAMNTLNQAMHAFKVEISKDFSMLFNTIDGSRAHRIVRPRGGGSSGGSSSSD